jgi:UDP-N-acetylmuramate: L-alanyl-gamma-D-glutamyl-meso-diaminopimelate ligase
MSAEYFSTSLITPLREVPPGGRIHVIGVCGVAMAQMAMLLASLGYRVSGSDKEFYEPMGGLLRASSVELHQGYRAENLGPELHLVVIGNAVSRDHPEVEEARRRKLPYSIFPQLLHELCIGERHSIAITGTHGKTTTTALGAFLLSRMGLSPSYFVGGASPDLPETLCRGAGKVSIVEGDEYDSAFFAKVPKFRFYGPATAIVTSIEFDHADIYPNLESIDREFDGLMGIIGESGVAICCIDDPGARRLLERWKGKTDAPRMITYGTSADAMVRLLRVEQSGSRQLITLRMVSGQDLSAELGIPGLYNARNAAALFAAFEQLGYSVETAAKYLGEFKGVRRRQEIRFDGAVTLIEDFAHHPTAVRETIQGIRARFPGRRLWAVFEPRSNTSRRKVFQADYEQAFDAADRVVLCAVTARSQDSGQELLSVEELVQGIRGRGKSAEALGTAPEVGELLSKEVQKGDVVLLMSNGAFGGLPALMEAEFQTKFSRTKA